MNENSPLVAVCCDKMRTAINRRIILPIYWTPTLEICEFAGYQFWARDPYRGNSKQTAMKLNSCPWCGTDLDTFAPPPVWIREATESDAIPKTS